MLILTRLIMIRSSNRLVSSWLSSSDLSVVEFLTQAENLAAEMQILIKKADKKKDKQLLQSHRAALIEKLQLEEDPAILLHLAVSLAFQNAHQVETITRADGEGSE